MASNEVECVSIVGVCLKLGIQLKFNGNWASARA
jgi:hypothetical protein